MSNFTYEEKNIKNKYETYEWDNTWLEHINDVDAKRVMYIGDSISCGIRRVATAKTNNEIFFDGLGTSKAIDNFCFEETIKLFAKQEGYRNAILFNNGLHGWHLDEDSEYRFYFEKTIKFLKEEFKDTPILILLTTFIKDESRLGRVIKRNEVVKEIADKYGLSIIDLYSVSKENADKMYDDGVHFKEEGCEILAEKIIEEIKNMSI